jgi:DNA repair ATPase RecN
MRWREIDKALRDLHTALKSLSDESLKTSRRLDDTYYSILEKVSVLRQTIGTLQELSGLTTELHDNFEADTKDLTDDVQGQIDGFNNFDKQQKQIVDMEQRVTESKTKADSLTDRLSKAKERVDTRARSEVEWEVKHTRMSPRNIGARPTH